MARTPQRFPGAALEDDSVQFEDRGSDPPEVGSLWRRGSSLYGRDGDGAFNLRQGSSWFDPDYILSDNNGGTIFDNAGNAVLRSA